MKHLIFCVLLFVQGLAQAQNMLPLPEWVQQHPQWRDNKQDMAYLANRCASAFDLVGNHFAVHATLDEQRRSANIFLNHSDTYVRVGYFLTVKHGLSESDAVENYNAINAIYERWMQDNLKSTGEVMQKPLSDDVELCLLYHWQTQMTVKELELEYASTKTPSPELSASQDKKLDMGIVQMVWAYIKSETKAPSDFPLPPLVVDPSLPTNARMVFQFPSVELPENTLQISVSPRTLSVWNRGMVSWAAGHELTHYAFLMRENGWVRQAQYQNSMKHHCNPEFIRLTSGIADLIADQLTSGKDRLRMYSEVFRSCSRHPNQ
jgi:hypothetical protein